MNEHNLRRARNIFVGLSIVLLLAFLAGDPAAFIGWSAHGARLALGLDPRTQGAADASVIEGGA